MTNFLSIALGQTLECWFCSFFFVATITIFKIKPSFLYIYQFNNQEKKIQEHTLFYIYIVARSKNSTRTLPYDFVFNNSRGCKNPNLFLIYVAETNQEIKDPVIRSALIPTNTNHSRFEWNSRTQDLSNPSLLKNRMRLSQCKTFSKPTRQ
jgi:hypothetical protein